MPSNERQGRQQLEWQFSELGHLNLPRERQASNPTSAAAAQLQHLNRGAELIFGRVVDAIPYVGTYKVLPERGLSVITCCHLSPAPNGAIGVRGVSSIPPGSHVWCIYHRDVNYGIIIGVESYFMTRANLALSDYIYAGSRSGLHRDEAHGLPWRLNTRGIGDWSAGKPFDNTTAGEWGGITETGLRVLLDSFMVQVGAGEACGLYAFLWDQLCRLTGINLQIRSNAFEWESLDDESEHHDMIGHVVYPWEALGAGRMTGDMFRSLGPEATEIGTPWYAATEPKLDDQIPVHRLRELYGYQGQGGKKLLQAPLDNTMWRYGAPGQSASLFEEHLALTGAYSLRSAHSLIIAKRPLIPRIYTKKRPEDPEGDSKEGYKASGQQGSGPDHMVKGNISAFGDDPHLIRHAGALDQLAYVFNWEAVHPQFYHKEDVALGEETGSAIGSSIPVPQFSALANHNLMWLPEPSYGSLNIDHRYRTVDYALSSSYIVWLTDGGIAIGDGYGAEIRMTGGHLHNTAAGDVWHKAGRNVVSWGGRDVLVRGKRHVDITATEMDVRIKAEQHAWILAANSGGPGMVLLESRSKQDQYIFKNDEGDPLLGEKADCGGIAFRAAKANVVTWGKEIYLRTGGGTVEEGDITLDASRDKKNIVTNSNTIVNYLPSATGGRYDAFYETQEGSDKIKVKCSHAFNDGNVFIDGNQEILGFVGVDGAYYGNDWIYLDNGHIATAEAPRYDLLVPPLIEDYFQWWFDELHSEIEELYKALEEFWDQAMVERWYKEKHGGHDEVMSIAEFSFRTVEQYRTLLDDELNFSLYEDRWQQLARLAGGGGSKWPEVWTLSQGLETAPYPGREVFERDGSYITVDLTMHDASTGTSKPRGDDEQPPDYYLNPKYGTASKKTLQNDYLVLG